MSTAVGATRTTRQSWDSGRTQVMRLTCRRPDTWQSGRRLGRCENHLDAPHEELEMMRGLWTLTTERPRWRAPWTTTVRCRRHAEISKPSDKSEKSLSDCCELDSTRRRLFTRGPGLDASPTLQPRNPYLETRKTQLPSITLWM